jgi:ELWxxDGT repeat protein
LLRHRLVSALALALVCALPVLTATPAGASGGARVVKSGLDGAHFAEGAVELNGILYWMAAQESRTELWRSDGTETGTQPFLESLSQVSSLSRFGDRLLFTANDGVHGMELWESDGTEAGTSMVADLNPDEDVNIQGTHLMAVTGGAAFLTSDDGTHGIELYRYTGAGTPQLLDINTTAKHSPVADLEFEWKEQWTDSVPSLVGVLGDTMLFAADNTRRTATQQDGSWYVQESGNGEELFRVGATGNPSLVKDITTVDGFGDPDPLEPTRFNLLGPSAMLNGFVYFVITGRHVIGGETKQTADLWRSDGTTGGTTQVAIDLPVYYDDSNSRWNFIPAVAGGKIFYQGWTQATSYDGLWATDGSGKGSRVGPPGDAGQPVALGGNVVYSMAGSAGREPWVSDGETASMLKDIVPGATGSNPFPYVEWKGHLYFGARTDTGRDLWRTDGTTAGTVKLHDLPQSTGAVIAGPITFAGTSDLLYFWHSRTDQRETDHELWVYDPAATPEQQTPVIKVTAPAVVRYGTAPKVTVTVAGAGTPTGGITLRDGTRVLATRPLVGGKAVFTMPADLGVGAHRLVASYTGDTLNEAGTSPATMLVKAATKLSGRIASVDFSTEDKIFVTATLKTTPAIRATGTLTALVDNRKVKAAALKASHNNKLRIVLNPLKRGRHTIQITFTKSPNAMNAKTGKVTVQIIRA